FSTMLLFYNATATTTIYTLSLHDALPICIERIVDADERDAMLADVEPPRRARGHVGSGAQPDAFAHSVTLQAVVHCLPETGAHTDRKSTRLNSSHVAISYAVFCLKKKKRT